MTTDEMFTFCCEYANLSEDLFSTLEFVVSVDGLNEDSINKWCYYHFGMEFDAFYDEVNCNE
jgi:hypothetical protein